jgi:Ca2+-binding RTX toxin-like protein
MATIVIGPGAGDGYEAAGIPLSQVQLSSDNVFGLPASFPYAVTSEVGYGTFFVEFDQIWTDSNGVTHDFTVTGTFPEPLPDSGHPGGGTYTQLSTTNGAVTFTPNTPQPWSLLYPGGDPGGDVLQYYDTTIPARLLAGDDLIENQSTTAAVLKGYGGADTLIAGSGGDTLDGGSGADSMVGGAGNDVFYVDNSGDVVSEKAGGGHDIVYVSAPHWSAPAGSAIEKVVAQGADNINLAGNGLAMELDGNAGINKLSDGGGADTLVGGAGGDVYVVANPGTMIVEQAGGGYDTVRTTLSSYTLPANVENLTYAGSGDFYGVGNATTGVIAGGPGDDTLVSGSGVEVLNGGGGHDTFYVSSPADVVQAAAGGGSVEYALVSGVKAAANIVALTLQGPGGLTGYANSTGTFLTGGPGHDTEVGGAGDDTLLGGGSAGGDVLIGGAGADQFRLAGPTTTYQYIIDFQSGADHIALGAGFGLASLADVTFDIGAGAAAQADGRPNIVYDTSTGALSFDASGGDGHLLQIALLSKHPGLGGSDFILI